MAERAWKPPIRLATDSTGSARTGIEIDRLRNGVVVAQVRGLLDDASAAELERRILAKVATGDSGPPHVVLELSGVTFLDHAGLDMLLRLQDRLAAVSGTLELLAPSSSVVRLLHEADLDGAAWMRPTVDTDG